MRDLRYRSVIRSFHILTALSLSLLFLNDSARASQITVSGYVYGTWEVDTVLVTGDIRIPPDNNLTINAGTKVLFDGNWQFRIDEYAQITAMGTPSNRI